MTERPKLPDGFTAEQIKELRSRFDRKMDLADPEPVDIFTLLSWINKHKVKFVAGVLFGLAVISSDQESIAPRFHPIPEPTPTPRRFQPVSPRTLDHEIRNAITNYYHGPFLSPTKP